MGPLELKRSLGLFDATAISVGAIIGAGIFVVIGMAAGLAGSALVVSILLAAAVSLATALSFAELAAWQPREGSIYEYAYQLISPFAGFLVGWMWLISNVFTGAAVALGFAHYLAAMAPAVPPRAAAACLCLALAGLNHLGVKRSARLNNFLVIAKLLVLVFFVVFGLMHADRANFLPFAPFRMGVLYGACFIFFAYGGFARVAILGDEIKEPARNVPRAILLSLTVSTAVYILVGIAAVGLVGAAPLAGSRSPLTRAVAATGSGAAASIVSAGALIATVSVLLTSILGVSRMAYAMAKRRDIPAAFARVHPRYGTPFLSIWISGAVMAGLALTIDLSRVVAISSFSLLFYYFLANVSALRLKPDKRLYPKRISAMGAVSCLALMAFTFFASFEAWATGVVCLAAGALYYRAGKRDRERPGPRPAGGDLTTRG